MRILITSRNSYIGNSLRSFLRDKKDFFVNEISVRDYNWKSVSFKDYDTIIHLAAIVHKNERNYSLKYFEKVNIDLTVDIARKAIEDGVKKFIFFSTMAVYGKTAVIKKDSPTNPITKYGISKLKAEEALISLTSQSKITLTIIRPPMIYGVGAKGNPNILEKFSKFCCFFPETNNKRSFISIDNLINTLIQDFDNKKNSILHPQDPNYLTTFQLFSYYCSKRNIKPYPLKLIGYLIRKLFFIRSLHKIFGNLYYDFVD
jgi:UDP-glucose 4-epimerase